MAILLRNMASNTVELTNENTYMPKKPKEIFKKGVMEVYGYVEKGNYLYVITKLYMMTLAKFMK